MSKANELRLLTMKAHRALNLEHDPDKARAIADQVYAALGDLDGLVAQQVSIHTSLATTFQSLGDPRAEEMIRTAIELEQKVAPVDSVAVGTHQLFYARWLFERGRREEAKRYAREGEASCRTGTLPDDPELQHVRSLVAQIFDTTRDRAPE